MHESFMRRCFELAKRGVGLVSPNPLVGAVAVKDGKIVAEGFHARHGEPHAEAHLFLNSKADLSGVDHGRYSGIASGRLSAPICYAQIKRRCHPLMTPPFYCVSSCCESGPSPRTARRN